MNILFQKQFLGIMKAVLGTAFFFFCLLVVSSPASASTNKSGTISSNETWNVAGSPYIITNWTYINSGVTVTIDPGVTVKVQAGGISVTGTLDVNGSSGSPAYITSYYDDAADGQNTDGTATPPAAGNWQYIEFNSGAVGDFSYTTIRYGASSCFSCAPSKMLWNKGGTVTFDESNLTNSKNYALYQETSGSVTMTGGLIDNNPLGVFYNAGTMSFDDVEIKDLINAQSNATSLTITDSYLNTGSVDSYTAFTFTGNTLAGATINIKKLTTTFTHSGNSVSSGVAGYYLSSLTSGNATLTAESGMAYLVADGFSVQSGHTLTVEAGSVFKFTNSSGSVLTVNGTLEVDGTSMAPVYFTSIKNDATGDDTNGDSTATSPAAGDWHGLQFESGSVGNFSYAVISYGGKACVPCANKEKMIWNKGGTLTFEDSEILSSYRYGLYQETSGSVSMVDGVIDNNTEGIYLKNGTMSFTGDVDIKDLIDAQSTATSLTITDSDLNTGSVYASAPFTFTGNTLTGATVRIKRLSSFTHSGNNVLSGNRGYFLDGQTASDATLTAESGLVYLIDAPFYVMSGHTLTIEPDSVVKFLNNTDDFLSVTGTLEVKGTTADPVYFTSFKDDAAGGDTNGDSTATSPTYGDWNGIEFTSGSVGNFSNAIIRYGGRSCTYCYPNQKMIWNKGGTLTLTDTDILSSANYAIYQETDGTVAMSGGKVDDNQSGIKYTHGAMTFMDDVEIKDLIEASSTADSLSIIDAKLSTGSVNSYVPFTFTNNELTSAVIRLKKLSTFIHSGNSVTSGVPGYYLSGTTGANARISPETGFVYLIDDSFSVLNGHTLAVDAGTIIKLAHQSAAIWVNGGGKLEANGYYLAPVYFTSYKDDSVGGDTNGNGASSGVAGDWGKINFASGSTGDLTHAVVRYGGYAGSASNQRMIESTGGNVTLTDSLVMNSYRYGFYQTTGTSLVLASILNLQITGAYIEGGSIDIVGSKMQSNSETGLFATGGTITISGSTISGNTSYGVYSSSPSIDAEGNYWGHASGPYHTTTNPAATGNRVSNNVDYDPWETSLETNNPSVAITSHANNDEVLSATIDVSGTVSDADSGVAVVKVNGINCVIVSGDWTCDDVPVQPYDNTVVANAWDNVGNRATTSLTIKRRVPVIVIPGTAGSHLKVSGSPDKSWLDLQRLYDDTNDDTFLFNELELNTNGGSVNTVVTDGILLNPSVEILSVTFDEDIYGGLVEELVNNNGYVESTSLFVFAYDWRLDLRDTKSLLNTEVESILASTHSDQLDIVAHSMGGLLAKQYIHDYGNTKIRKLVTVGVPHLGSVDALEVLTYGTDFGINSWWPNLIITIDRVKELAKNMLSVYNLLPSPTYISEFQGYLYEDGQDLMTYNESIAYLKGLQLSGNNRFNNAMFDEMEETHEQHLAYLDFGTTQVYNIIACTIATHLSFGFDTNGEINTMYTTGGDGTVPGHSGHFVTTPNSRKYYSADGTYEHGLMASKPNIRQGIADILAEANPGALSGLDNDTANCGASGQSGTYQSPVDVHIYDSQGRHTGPNENGAIDREIPGVSYDIFGHYKHFFLPDNGEEYTVKAVGTDKGTFDLRLTEYEKDKIKKTRVFNDVPVEVGTESAFRAKGRTLTESISVKSPNGEKRQYQPYVDLQPGEEVDNRAPITEAKRNKGEQNVISLSASDANPNDVKTYYSFDGNNFTEYKTPIELDAEKAGTLYYYSIDKAGNTEEILVLQFNH